MNSELVILGLGFCSIAAIGLLMWYFRKLMVYNAELAQTLAKEQRLLAEKAFLFLKEQTGEQAIRLSDLESQLTIQRDAAYDELKRHREETKSYEVSGNVSQYPQYVTALDGQQYDIRDLDVTEF